MKLSKLYFQTLKEVPSDADNVSTALLIRSGMIRKAGLGLYTYLPLGYKVILKIENIIRKQMDTIASELNMPILIPGELWLESGRYETMGAELWRTSDRHLKKYVIGPTHEEMIVSVVRDRLTSYQELPIHLYQIQTKVRDERRPRFGLIRAREFIMKDSYSFHEFHEEVEKELEKTEEVYRKILDELELTYLKVIADSGAIGGSSSFEFHVIADCGEDLLLFCPNCLYASNVEKAIFKIDSYKGLERKKELVLTKDIKSIEHLSSFFNTPKHSFIKTMIYIAGNTTYAILIRGDLEINEFKLNGMMNLEAHLATSDELKELGLVEGFIGPINLDKKIIIYADHSIKNLTYQIFGANKLDYHNVGYTLDDYLDKVTLFEDFSLSTVGATCPHCDSKLTAKRGIEVGHIFNLGDKYSKSMNATYVSESGEKKNYLMGCYGLGVSRLLSAIIEQKNDKDGIIFPRNVAPFEVVLVPVSNNELEIASKYYQILFDTGIDVALDDRDLRFGVKLKDIDLIGTPIKVIFGKLLASNSVEVKDRLGTVNIIKLEELVDFLKSDK